MASVDVVLDEWFGPLDEQGHASPEKSKRWFEKNAGFDAHLRERYGEWVERALMGELDAWCSEPAGRVALLLLLDQFTRNIFRGTPRMFEGDPHALGIARETAGEEADAMFLPVQRSFTLMPLMHSEVLGDQEACVQAFERLSRSAPPSHRPGFAYGRDYAIAHRDIVARFGRFPHRNETLGRTSTPEELEFLKQPGSAF